MKDVTKPWMVKVLTDLGTRLLVVIKPDLLVKDLQGAIEHDHRAAYPGCGEVQCQLLSVLEYEDGRDVPSSVHSRYRLQDVLRSDGARVYAEFLDKALKHTASLCNGITPLQIGLSPHLTPLDPGSRGTLTSPREHTGQHAAPRQTAISLQASPGVGSKRGMEVAPEPSEERASKKARLDAQLGEDGKQAGIAAALPSYPAGHGALKAGSQERMQLNDASHHLTEAAAHSAGRAQQGMQPDLGKSSRHNDRDTQAGADKDLQQHQQRNAPSSVHSKQSKVAHELPAARTAEELPKANGMQQDAHSESSSEAEASSEEDSLPGNGLASPGANVQQHPLASQEQQPQEEGNSQPAAQNMGRADEAQSSSGSEEESGSSSEEEDNQLDPVPSNPAHQLPAHPVPTQKTQGQVAGHGAAHSPGREEEGSSSEDDSTSNPSSAPVAKQHPAPERPAQAQQTGKHQDGLHGRFQGDSSSGEVDGESSEEERKSEAPVAQAQQNGQQQTGLNTRVQSDSSTDEGDSESSEEARGSEAPAAPNSKQAARDQAKQGALGAEKSSSSSSSSGSEAEGRGRPQNLARRLDSQRQPDLVSGGEAMGSGLAQQSSGKAPAQQVPNKAAPTQHGPWGPAAQEDGSSSSEDSESSDAEQPPRTAADPGQMDSAEKQPSAQAASHRAGKEIGQGLQGHFTPIAHRTRQGGRAGHEAEGHAATSGGKSAAHDDESSSGSEEDITPRNDQRVVSQEQYELLQQMESIQLEQPNINSFKVIMDAMTAQRAAEREAAKQAPTRAVTRGMAGEEAAEVLQHAAEQTAQGADEDADQRADVAASSRKHASTKRLSDEAHLGRALIKATQEERARQQAEQEKVAQNPFSRPTGSMTDKRELKHVLLHNLHPIVAHEQGITLKTAAGMFKEAQKPDWWPPTVRWNKSQLDLRVSVLQQIYAPARKRWQSMKKALQ